ncbi:MAG: MOSC domain-containing protein [Syntrophothermus sp.]
MGAEPGGRIAWISSAPVKGLRLQALTGAELTVDGIPGDRAFFLVDRGGEMVSATRLGPLLAVVAEHDREAGALSLRFPGGEVVAGPVELGEPEPVRFYGAELRAQPLAGPFSAALSRHAGVELRVFAAPPERPGVDRGRAGAVTLLSLASLERLREAAGEAGPIDARRFRMTIGVEGLAPHGEDEWVGREIRVGGARVRVGGRVGRCAATTRNPDSGAVDLKTLHHLASYRSEVASEEPLPFGVFGAVTRPGAIALGDPVGQV